MTRKVIKIGTSTGITIPKEVLEELGLSTGDEVELEIDPKANKISVTPTVGLSKADKKIAKLTMDFINRYRSDLTALADK